MAIPSSRDLETNELKMWANWANAKRLGKDTYVLNSERFREPFFNRASFMDCGAVSFRLEAAEELFRLHGVIPTVTVNNNCHAALGKLDRSGYRSFETMTVMISKGPFKPVDYGKFEVSKIPAAGVSEWSRAYLLSFYGEESLLNEVTKVAKRLVRNRSATLLEARLDGAAAGVLAIYRTPGLAGVYCVGTVPRFRRRGVAGTLLARAAELAASEGRRVILQTLKSDGVESFYTQRGFVALYRKSFLRRES